jgi:ABC-type antimicrobial peptide transport system permease subunit
MLSMFIGIGFALGMVLTMMGLVGESIGQLMGDYEQTEVSLYVSVQGGILVPFDVGDNPGTIDHASSVIAKIRSIPGVQSAVGALSWSMKEERPGPQSQRQPTKFVPAMAIDGNPSAIPGLLVIRQGRWIRRGNEVVLGTTLSTRKSLEIGDSLRMNGLDYEVVGIGKVRGFGPTGDAVAYIDAQTLRQRGVIGDILNYIAVYSTEPDAVRSVVGQISSLRANSPRELTHEMQESDRYTSAFIIYWLMDLFILFVAGMFVSNVLGRSVAERRLQFGTLRAIGLPGFSILLTVAMEALVIILGSFAVGVVVSMALGASMNIWVAPSLGYPRLFSPDLAMYLIIFGLALIMGLLAAFFPARSATRVDPLEVLREA